MFLYLLFRVKFTWNSSFEDSICYSELESKNLEMLVFDSELCHSTLKPIGDEEDTLKSFMAFHITQRVPVFGVVVGSQIVVPLTIPPS